MHRAKVFTILGAFWIAPVLHIMYSKVLPYYVPIVTYSTVFKKLAIDQLMFAPCFIGLFYPVVNLIEGNSLRKGF